MSLAVAVPFGLASAVVLGASIVVQHKVAHEQSADAPSAVGLLRLLKRPIFLLALGGDFIGFLLNLVALSTGPVVVIQPLVVLMLPVALVLSALTGARRPTRGDYLGVGGVVLGLGAFLTLMGTPGEGQTPQTHILYLTIGVMLVAVVGTSMMVRRTGKLVRGAVYGAAAGACFGTLAVLVDTTSERLSEQGVHGLLDSPQGVIPIIGMIIIGMTGIALTQISFQVGKLGATLPANVATDPLVAVTLGALVLGEHIAFDAPHLIAYLASLGIVLAGAIRLANPGRHLNELARVGPHTNDSQVS